MKSIINMLTMLFVPVFRLYATHDSTQAGYTDASPPTFIEANQWNGKVRFFEFDYTQDGAATAADLVRLVFLPAGKCRLILPLSRIAFSAQGGTGTMNLGWLAYTDLDGDAVAADENGLDDGVDISSAGSVNPGGTLGGAETKLFESLEGLWITATLADDAFPDAGTLKGYFLTVVE